MNKPRSQYVSRNSNKKLRSKTVVEFDRAIDRIAQALRNIDEGNTEYAIKNLHRALEYVVDLRVLNREIWGRYVKTMRDARACGEDRRKLRDIIGVEEFAAITLFMEGLDALGEAPPTD
jgi:hypothetical protein